MLKRANYSRERLLLLMILNLTRSVRQPSEKVPSILFSPASSESSHYPESFPGSRWKLSMGSGCHNLVALTQLAPWLLCGTPAETLQGSPIVELLACCLASLWLLCVPQVAPGTGGSCSAAGLSCLGSPCWGCRLRESWEVVKDGSWSAQCQVSGIHPSIFPTQVLLQAPLWKGNCCCISHLPWMAQATPALLWHPLTPLVKLGLLSSLSHESIPVATASFFLPAFSPLAFLSF